MTLLEVGRRAIHCPVKGCGCTLGEVAGAGPSSFWRVCPKCKATIRVDLPRCSVTIEQAPRRPA